MSNALRQIPLDLQGRTAHARDDFLVTPSNRSAVQWVDRWPDWPAPLLVVSGPAASGKSHLAAVWKEKSGAEQIKPEMLISRGADQIAQAGKNLLLDDVDPWLGEREVERTLFHLYNMFKEEGRFILMTMRMSPTEVDFEIPDLASRTRAAPHAEIHAPDDMLLASVLMKLFRDRQLSMANDVIKYVLPRMERSFAAARDLVTMADRLALSRKSKISVPLMRDALVALQEEREDY